MSCRSCCILPAGTSVLERSSVVVNDNGTASRHVVNEDDIIVPAHAWRCRALGSLDDRTILGALGMRALGRCYRGYRLVLLLLLVAIVEIQFVLAVGRYLWHGGFLGLGWDLDLPWRRALYGFVVEGFLAGEGVSKPKGMTCWGAYASWIATTTLT